MEKIANSKHIESGKQAKEYLVHVTLLAAKAYNFSLWDEYKKYHSKFSQRKGKHSRHRSIGLRPGLEKA